MNKQRVAFICVHNSCRSQIAEALTKHIAKDVIEPFSAGTNVKDIINKDAVRLIKKLYDINMNKTQFSKLINDIPKIDILITMGCNVECPYIPCRYKEDWGLEDPSGKSDEEFIKIIKIIEKKVLDLKNSILSNSI